MTHKSIFGDKTADEIREIVKAGREKKRLSEIERLEKRLQELKNDKPDSNPQTQA